MPTRLLKSRRLWVAAIAIAILLGAVRVRSHQQRVAVENAASKNILRLGGGLSYGDNPYSINLPNWVPTWLKTLWWRAGPGGVVEGVYFGHKMPPPRERLQLLWESLSKFPTVTLLTLNRLPLEDADLADLPPLPWLNTLDLSATDIGDDGLAHLSRHKQLTRLYLINTRVTDAGLAHLKQLPNLQTLILDGTLVTDEGMQHLAELTNLTEVSLSNTAVTEAGVALLAERIPNLSISDD